MEVRTEETKCWNCKKDIDTLKSLGDKGPKQGDATVCFYCGEISILNEDNLPIEPTIDQYLDIRLQMGRTIDKIQAGIKTLREKKG